jgi:hypothetical protein
MEDEDFYKDPNFYIVVIALIVAALFGSGAIK